MNEEVPPAWKLPLGVTPSLWPLVAVALCNTIYVIDGLYFEASQTTPFHYLTASMMSPKAGHSQRRLPYGSYDMTTGIDRLRKLGVRYVLLGSDSAKTDASRQPALHLVASSGPYQIFEIRDSAVVSGLAAEPVVVTGVEARELGAFTDVGIAQWVRPQTFPSTVAFDGPPYWKRVALVRGSTATTPPPTPAARAFCCGKKSIGGLGWGYSRRHSDAS